MIVWRTKGRLSELFSAVLCTTIIVHSYKLQLLGTASDLGLVKGFLSVLGCFIYLGPVCSFSVFFVYFLLFVLSCPYQCKRLPVKTRL